jgi:choline-sulfatase
MRKWRAWAAAGAGLLIGAGVLWWLVGSPWADDRPLNVIVLSMDTTRRDHLTFYGYRRDTTPHLQRALADRGVVFDQAIAVATNTAPAHGSMFTGLYPTTHGIQRNGMRLRDDVSTMAEALQEAGYATGGFVSGWTLTRHTDLDRGFETYDDEIPGKGWRQRRPANATLARALPWMRARAGEERPFFLFVHVFDPHHPYDPPPGYGERFLPKGKTAFTTVMDPALPHSQSQMGLSWSERREYVSRYDGEIAFADHELGRLLDEVTWLGLDDRTLVILIADHGETLLEREFAFSHGGQVYDEQIHVPFVMRLPKRIGVRPGRFGAPVSQVDIFPTVLSLLGLAAPEGMAGHSLLPFLRGEAEPDERRPMFANARPEYRFVPEVTGPIGRQGLVAAVRLPEVKLIEYPAPRGAWTRQLFDLRKDPREKRNLVDAQPELVQELSVLLDEWRRATGGEERQEAPTLSPEVHRALRALGYVE